MSYQTKRDFLLSKKKEKKDYLEGFFICYISICFKNYKNLNGKFIQTTFLFYFKY